MNLWRAYHTQRFVERRDAWLGGIWAGNRIVCHVPRVLVYNGALMGLLERVVAWATKMGGFWDRNRSLLYRQHSRPSREGRTSFWPWRQPAFMLVCWSGSGTSWRSRAWVVARRN